MATIDFVKAGEPVERYNDAATDEYVEGQEVEIIDAANKLGMPQIYTAIAGAMAEENNSYLEHPSRDDLIDKYALSGLTAADLVGITESSLLGGWTAATISIVSAMVTMTTTTRTHQEWVDLFDRVDDGKTVGSYEKIENPVLIDLGKGNIQLATAIRLLQETDQDTLSVLGLTEYEDHYDKLASDLVNNKTGLAAKFYGLKIVEADGWFKEHKAYGSDWNTLPQVIKDALYITYVNIGRGQMNKKYDEATDGGNIPLYEPLPAAGAAAGLNHLFNAADIAATMGATDYSDIRFTNTAASWAEYAKEDSDKGAAYREALLKLRAFVVQDGNYDNRVTDVTDFGDQYLQDRAVMLTNLVQLKYDGVSPNSSFTYIGQDDIYGSIRFYDAASGMSVQLGTLEHQLILFGDANANELSGGDQADRIYGMKGQDTLNGGSGNDTFFIMGEDTAYDTFLGGEGDGDKILGSSGNDTIRLHKFDATNSIEIISGGGGTDIIAGTDGSDTIDLSKSTLIGIARIEGGAGEDIIVGSNAADILYGGSFDLPEDTAQDRLEGGAGNDTYYIGAGDTISDSDNQGTIWFGGRKLPSLTLTQIFENLNYYESADKSYRATLDSDTGTLAIHGTGYGTGVFYLENFAVTSSGLGITLEEYQKPEAEFDHTLLGTEGMQLVDFLYNIGGESVYYYTFKNFWLDSGENEHSEIVSDLGKVTITESFEIHGGAGNDRLIGLAGSDLLVGGEGHDVIFGIVSEALPIIPNQKGDTIEGNGGNDLLIGSGGDDSISGGEGMDCIVGASGIDTMLGDAESDVLVGGAGNDTGYGGTGNDVLLGDGDFLYRAGAKITEMPLNFVVSFTSAGFVNGISSTDVTLDYDANVTGDDTLFGGAGNDFLSGGSGDDKLYGESDQDTLEGGEGHDRLEGGTGNDLLIGDNWDGTGAGNDTIAGGGGNDILIGGGGSDTLFGGEGDDFLQGDNSDHTGNGNDTLHGGEGDDHLEGGEGNDIIYGDSGTDAIYGDADNDWLYGGAGNDSLSGDAGDDILDGGAGNDSLKGGAGNDLYLLQPGHGMDVIEDQEGANTIRFAGINFSQMNEYVRGTFNASAGTMSYNQYGKDILIRYGNEDAVIIKGGVNGNYLFEDASGNRVSLGKVMSQMPEKQQYGGDNDSLNVTSGQARVYLGGGNDTVYGGDGDDVLLGSDGLTPAFANLLVEGRIINIYYNGIVVGYGYYANDNDQLHGGGGNDIIDGGGGQDGIWGDDGNDSLYGGDGRDYISGGSGKDLIDGGNDRDDLHGNDGDDKIFGGDGDDHLDGGIGNDTLLGGSGNDLLDGGEGNDRLMGGSGDDRLRGDSGSDVIDGGDGIDELSYDGSLREVTVGVTVNLQTGLGCGGDAEGDIISGIEDIIGSHRDDIIYGNDGDNSIDGNGGDDEIYGGAGDDRISAESASHIYGGAGNDILCLSRYGGSGPGGWIYGDDGDDRLSGDYGDDIINGGSGDDFLFGESGDDHLIGGAGNDILNGISYEAGDQGESGDILEGGEGNDTYIFDFARSGLDKIWDNLGNNTIIFQAWLEPYEGDFDVYRSGQNVIISGYSAGCEIVGGANNALSMKYQFGKQIYTHTEILARMVTIETYTNASERIVGSADKNIIYAGGGNDTILAMGGKDILYGEAGNDLLRGGEGADLLDGGDGVDSVDYRDSGSGVTIDLAYGTASGGTAQGDTFISIENLYGSEYNDELSGSDDANTLVGFGGNDFLNGQEGNDYLQGRDGDDELFGEADNDLLRGGEGADLLDGGDGVDSVDYRDSAEGVTIDLAIGTASGGTAIGDTFVSIENLYGSECNDGLSGNDDANTLVGFGGNDLLIGNGGNDHLQGREGDDELFGNEGNDLLRGGEGADLLNGGEGLDSADYRDSAEGVTIDLAIGTASGGTAVGDTFISIENLYGSKCNDGLIGNDDANTLVGFGGNDFLSGNGGNDHLQGRDGDDELFGGDGNDLLRGGEGADLLDGGEGLDSVDYRDSAERVVIDLTVGTASGGTAEGDILLSIENVYGTEFNDTVIGNTQVNILLGYDGNDILSGDAGNDKLDGGNGADFLFGGLGNDVLIGGAGNDSFVFDFLLDAAANKDFIKDFVPGLDTIQLDKSIFTSLVDEGTLSSNFFKSGTTAVAADANDYFLYNTSSGALFYDMDGNGQGMAVQFATLTTKPAITANDFLITA